MKFSDIASLHRTRSARQEDIWLLQAIERDAARSYAAIPETSFCVGASVRDKEEHDFARERGLALVVEVGAEPAGFILVVPKDRSAHLLEIAVVQAQQARGYGRELIRAAEIWAVETGFDEMTLTTFRDVPWNAPFYARLGYKIFAVGPDRPELAEVIAKEAQLGFHKAPRVAMRKDIADGATRA